MIHHPCWWDSAQPDDEDAPVPARADVAVVGAGYTGLAAARRLAASGAEVVVLDRARAGWGASSRNAGQVLTGLTAEPATLVARAGAARAKALFELSLEAIAELERLVREERIECDYRRSGHLQAAAKPSHFDAFRDEQALLARVFGHRVELVTRERQRSELGSDAYHGLLVDERSGSLDPARYVAGLAAAARRAGARIVGGCEVRVLRRTGSRWSIDTARGPVDAGEILVATNGYSATLPWLRSRVVPIGSYVIATEPLSPPVASSLLPTGRMGFDSRHVLHYFRLTPDRRLLFGGRARFSARPAEEDTERAAAILRRDLLRVFPDLEATRIEYAWGGTVGFTRDRMPHAGRADWWYSVGYGGHGIALATHLGTVVARRIAGESLAHPMLDDRFRAIPLYRGYPWFLPLVGAYYRVRDLVG